MQKARELFCSPRLNPEPYDPDFWATNELASAWSDYNRVLWVNGISDRLKKTVELKNKVFAASHWHEVLLRANRIDKMKRDLDEVSAEGPRAGQNTRQSELEKKLEKEKEDQEDAIHSTRQLRNSRREHTFGSAFESRSKSSRDMSARRSAVYFPS